MSVDIDPQTAVPAAPVKPKPWIARHKFLTGFGVFMLIGAIGSATGAGNKTTNTAATKPASTASSSVKATTAVDPAKAAADAELKANDGQTPAQITTGFCQAIANKLTEYGMPSSVGNLETQADSAQYTLDVAAVVSAVHKVGNDAGVTAAGVEEVKQWPALTANVRADYVKINNDLLFVSNIAGATYTLGDMPTFNAAISVLNSAMKSFTNDCSAVSS